MIEPRQHDLPLSLSGNKHDVELADEARLADDFARLFQQYCRAGYECYAQIQQSDPVLAYEDAVSAVQPVEKKPGVKLCRTEADVDPEWTG